MRLQLTETERRHSVLADFGQQDATSNWVNGQLSTTKPTLRNHRSHCINHVAQASNQSVYYMRLVINMLILFTSLSYEMIISM